MTVEELARAVIAACEQSGANHMITGAFAFNYYGLPRATHDIDIVVEIRDPGTLPGIISRLGPEIAFDEHVQFDTATWGRRHIGHPRGSTTLSVELFELFELFDDPFVMAQFARRRQLDSLQLGRAIHLPTAEDIVVQKLRWARPKDLEDARDILAVQGLEGLDLPYIETWCAAHGTSPRLRELIASLPEF